jgi:aerobic carbon-monoxide dehydrogenase medium subunit
MAMPTHTHPALPEFEYIRPQTLQEACEFLARHPGEARPFLGGSDVFVQMRTGVLAPQYLVDMKPLADLRQLRFDPQAGLTLGAAVAMNQVIASPEVRDHYPLLAEACRSVANYTLRNRATVVGNLCLASPAGDTLGACLAFNGRLHVQSVRGPRDEPLAAFFLGPGQTTLQADEIVTALHLPPSPPNSQGVYLKLGRNRMGDMSLVGVTALGYADASAASGWRFRLILASVAPVPVRATAAEDYLARHSPTPEVIRAAAGLAADSCSPIDDVRSSAQYRRQMVIQLSTRALTAVWARLSG